MSKNEDGKDSLHRADPELTIQLARYGCLTGYRFESTSTFPFKDSNGVTERRAMLIVAGTHINDARTLNDWPSYTDEYPGETMEPGELSQRDNPNVAVRAYFLRQAVSKLLALVEAPPAMAADINVLLDSFVPRGAETRRRVQKAILEDPGASLQQIATRANANPGQISKDGKSGLLFWPADPVGATPSGSK